MKTKIKIGGVACNLEDMPSSFQDAVKRGMEEDGIKEEIKIDRDIEKLSKVEKVEKLKVTKVKKIAEVSIYRKMFGYRSGMFD